MQCTDAKRGNDLLCLAFLNRCHGRHARSMTAKRISFSTVSSHSKCPELALFSRPTVEAVVSNSLAMLDSDRTRIRHLLMQMALADNKPASKAVLQSILALASLHRDGDQSHAARLKPSALRALTASTERGINARAGIQHIAAGLLLCAFEVLIDTSFNSCRANEPTPAAADNRKEFAMGGAYMWRERCYRSPSA